MENSTNAPQPSKKYKKLKTIGQGAYGKAILVMQKDKTHAIIKVINITTLDDEGVKDALQEAKIMEVCNHPNIP